MFATAFHWLAGCLSRRRTPAAVRIAAEKRRLEDLLRAEGLSRKKAQRIVARFFTTQPT